VGGHPQSDPAGVGRDSGRNHDQLFTERGASGPRVRERGQTSGRPEEIVGDPGTGQPGTVGPEPPGGQVRQGAVDEIGEDLLNEGIRMRR